MLSGATWAERSVELYQQGYSIRDMIFLLYLVASGCVLGIITARTSLQKEEYIYIHLQWLWSQLSSYSAIFYISTHSDIPVRVLAIGFQGEESRYFGIDMLPREHFPPQLANFYLSYKTQLEYCLLWEALPACLPCCHNVNTSFLSCWTLCLFWVLLLFFLFFFFFYKTLCIPSVGALNLLM